MSHSVKFEFKQSTVYKKGAEGRSIYTAIASTAALDRDKEVLIPRGVILDNFMKNPVMLFIHDSRSLPIGRVLSIDVTDEAVKFDFEFYDDQTGKQIENMYRTGFMNAFSVGFRPKAYLPLWDIPEEVNNIDFTLPDGTNSSIDLSKYAERPWGIIPKWELLEISPVPVPSNPEALMQRAKDEIVRKYVSGGNSKAAASILDTTLTTRMEKISQEIEDFMKTLDSEISVSNVVPYEKAVKSVDADFVNIAEVATLAAACTEDHSGEREKMDWATFSKAFAWFNAVKADSFTSYKLMHHVYVGEELVLSKSALFMAMTALLGQDKTVTEVTTSSDAEDVYAHLAKHYEDVGLTAPAYGEEYTKDQLKLIFEGKDPAVKLEEEKQVFTMQGEDTTEATDSDLKELIAGGLDELQQQMKELEVGLNIRLQLVVRMLEELAVDVSGLMSKESAEDETETETDSENSAQAQATKDFCAKLSALQNLFNTATI